MRFSRAKTEDRTLTAEKLQSKPLAFTDCATPVPPELPELSEPEVIRHYTRLPVTDGYDTHAKRAGNIYGLVAPQ